MSAVTRVHFYHDAADRFALAGELVARARARGHQLSIRLADAASMQAFDRRLWTAEPTSFIAHASSTSALAEHSPVLLAAAGEEARWLHYDTLFNLAADVAPDSAQFRRVVEIVGRDDADRQLARARWQEYKRRGLDPKAVRADAAALS